MLKIKNKVIAVILGLILSTLAFSPVYALTPSDDSKSNISVEYKYNDKIFADVEVDIYYVAKWENDYFSLTDDFEKSNVKVDFSTTPNASQWKDVSETIAEYARKNKCIALTSIKTDEKGIAKFENLENGIYYIKIKNAKYNGDKLICEPILVTVPTYEGQTNTWGYNVTVTPKLARVEVPDKPDKPNEPDKPNPPDEPDKPSVGIIPDTGTLSYLITPLSLIGILIFGIGLFGFLKERKAYEEES